MTQSGQETQGGNSSAAEAFTVVHGQVSYLQIPATDIQQLAAFYQSIFGWKVHENGRSFESPAGLIGQWVSDRPVSRDSGVVLWIYVNRIDDTLEQATAQGGEVLDPPSPDGPRWLATCLDPAGNVIGVWQQGPR